MAREKRFVGREVAEALSGDLPKVALIGRPNVGKSTLFNRLIRSNRAITHDMPGVTRDRMEGYVKRRGYMPFLLVDTGGVTMDSHATAVEGPSLLRGFEKEILAQAQAAVSSADALCLVVDGREGITPFDVHIADFLRKHDKPLIVVVNKVDGQEKADLLCAEFYVLGFELIPCSAEHGFNINELLSAMRSMLPDEYSEQSFDDDNEESEFDEISSESSVSEVLQDVGDSELAGDKDSTGKIDESTDVEPGEAELKKQDGFLAPEEDFGPLRIAMLGRPNVGKSSLVNTLTRQQRMIVSDVAGTTRDSVDVPVEIDGQECIFVDSAGVRRRSKITNQIEKFSVNSSLKTSSKAHITVLVLDGQEGLTQQDKRLLELLDERKIPFIVVVNKTDLIDPKVLPDVEKRYRKEFAYCPHIPLLMVSAHNRRNLRKIIPLSLQILRESRTRVRTGQLNKILEQMLQTRQPPLIKSRRAKIYYMTQAESCPPTFVFFVSDLERIPEAYVRYLERGLRKIIGVKHTPIRVHIRQVK